MNDYTNAPFPSPASPFTGQNGALNPQWQRLLVALWGRTGGATGKNSLFAYVSGSSSQPFNVETATTATEATPLAQVQSLDSAVLSTAESFATNAANTAQSNAESYTVSYTATFYAPLASPALTGLPTAPTAASGTNTTQIATTAFAYGEAQTAQSNAEAFATAEVHTNPGGAIVSVTVGPSPFTYTATETGHMATTGSSTTLTLARGATTINIKNNSAFIPMRNGDVLTSTYSTAPGMSWIPD